MREVRSLCRSGSRASLALATLSAALVCAGCGSKQDPSEIVVSGHVEATDVRISTKVAGRLLEMPLEEGSPVSAGQQLARMDETDLELSLQQARAERDQAAAELRLRLAGARPEDVAELEAQVRGVEADLQGAQRDFERLQALLDRGSGTAKARDDAATRRDMLTAKAASTRQALARTRAGYRAEEKDAARARLATAEARIAQLEQQLRDARVTAPLAGVVTEKLAEPGELLQAGAPLLVLTNLKDPWLTVYVGALDLPKLRLGQAAQVVTDDGQAREGRLTFISPQAEFTPKNVQTRDERIKLVYKLKLSLPNDDGLFKPGMPAEARFRSGVS